MRNWRRDRDSNPGREKTLNGFQDRRDRPLCHLSDGDDIKTSDALQSLFELNNF